ncbi:hypothetical protein [Mucisphaera sp.]|uniref:hypothetical protein n=1 Tax=Mucisphaera sp. TaxID=2913024 RepID=UPI003D1502B3
MLSLDGIEILRNVACRRVRIERQQRVARQARVGSVSEDVTSTGAGLALVYEAVVLRDRRDEIHEVIEHLMIWMDGSARSLDDGERRWERARLVSVEAGEVERVGARHRCRLTVTIEAEGASGDA